jgi:hypothetical protein
MPIRLRVLAPFRAAITRIRPEYLEWSAGPQLPSPPVVENEETHIEEIAP